MIGGALDFVFPMDTILTMALFLRNAGRRRRANTRRDSSEFIERKIPERKSQELDMVSDLL